MVPAISQIRLLTRLKIIWKLKKPQFVEVIFNEDSITTCVRRSSKLNEESLQLKAVRKGYFESLQ